MSMPETPMHKNHCAALWKNDVRLSRQIAPLQAKTKTKFVEKGAHLSFRRCVGRADAAHDIASFFWRKRIQNANQW
jgi:hypothetical protein